MGYNTTYNLTMPRNPITPEQLAAWIESDDEAGYSLDSDGSSKGDESRWYEHEASMEVLSAKYPNTIFKLHGSGQEQGDVWDKYFAGGKLQHEERLKTDLPVPDLDAMVPPPDPSLMGFIVTLTLEIPAKSRESLQQIIDTVTTYELIDMARSINEVIEGNEG